MNERLRIGGKKEAPNTVPANSPHGGKTVETSSSGDSVWRQRGAVSSLPKSAPFRERKKRQDGGKTIRTTTKRCKVGGKIRFAGWPKIVGLEVAKRGSIRCPMRGKMKPGRNSRHEEETHFPPWWLQKCTWIRTEWNEFQKNEVTRTEHNSEESSGSVGRWRGWEPFRRFLREEVCLQIPNCENRSERERGPCMWWRRSRMKNCRMWFGCGYAERGERKCPMWRDSELMHPEKSWKEEALGNRL